MVKKYVHVLITSLLAGLLISIGGLVYCSLYTDYKPLGAFLFGFGLFTIIVLKYSLYTGKIGYVIDHKANYLLELLICLFGNALMVFLVGFTFNKISTLDDRLTTIITNARVFCETKLNTSWITMLVLSFFCGIIIYLIVEVGKREVHPLYKAMMTFAGIAIFILCGFEHCIANMFYFSLYGHFSLKILGYILLMILGNSLGSIFLHALMKLTARLKEER